MAYPKPQRQSIEEVTTYFDPAPHQCDPARRVKVTEYAKAQEGWAYEEAQNGWYGTTEYDGNGSWWLRSPGFSCDLAAVIGVDGINGINSQFGTDVDTFEFVVCPALWIAY